MADGATKTKGPRTLCAEAAEVVLREHLHEVSLEQLTVEQLAREVSNAVIAVALDHITVRMNFTPNG